MTLQEVLRTDKPVMIDFFSADCPPCLLMSEVLKKIDHRLENKCEIFTIDRAKHPRVFEMFQIKTLPHLKLFKNGKPVWSGSGLFNQDELFLLIEKHLEHGEIK